MSWKKQLSIGFVKPTREYVCGLLTGAGLGMNLGQYFAGERFNELSVVGFVLIAVGSTGARLAQRDSDAANQANL